MIRPLRIRHRRAVTALACVLLPLTVIAFASRTEVPVSEASSPPGRAAVDDAPWPASSGAWQELGLSARIVRRGGESVLELRPERDLRSPDLLVYVAAGPTPDDGLPTDARLLGSIGSRPRGFLIPAGVDLAGDRVVLFSLGHRSVLGEAPFPTR